MTEPTEIYLPRRHFAVECRVDTGGVPVRQGLDAPGQRLQLWAAADGLVTVTLTRMETMVGC
jgi:hypothetical protein